MKLFSKQIALNRLFIKRRNEDKCLKIKLRVNVHIIIYLLKISLLFSFILATFYTL